MGIDHSGIIEELGAHAPGKILIAGAWHDGHEQLPVVDPATGQQFSTITQSTAEQVDAAVNACQFKMSL